MTIDDWVSVNYEDKPPLKFILITHSQARRVHFHVYYTSQNAKVCNRGGYFALNYENYGKWVYAFIRGLVILLFYN